MDFEQFYQDKYPAGIPREVDLNKYQSMVTCSSSRYANTRIVLRLLLWA